jgi:hypothetical protein
MVSDHEKSGQVEHELEHILVGDAQVRPLSALLNKLPYLLIREIQSHSLRSLLEIPPRDKSIMVPINRSKHLHVLQFRPLFDKPIGHDRSELAE